MKLIVFVIKLFLVLLMVTFIWGQSMMPADLSSRESELVRRVLEPVIEPVQRLLAERGWVVEQSFLVRKAAHFSEYAALGALMYLLFVRSDGRGRYILPGLLCLSVAAIDEGIQIFAVDRGPALRDVALDFAGAWTGILAAALVILILYCGLRPQRKRK